MNNNKHKTLSFNSYIFFFLCRYIFWIVELSKVTEKKKSVEIFAIIIYLVDALWSLYAWLNNFRYLIYIPVTKNKIKRKQNHSAT